MSLSLPAKGSVNWDVTLNAALTYLDTNKLGTWVAVPESSSSVGTAGQLAKDSSYLYVCVAANTWKRVGLSTW